MSPGWVLPDIGKSFVSGHKELLFLLNDFPELRILGTSKIFLSDGRCLVTSLS